MILEPAVRSKMHYASLETGRMLGTSLRPETGLRLAPDSFIHKQSGGYYVRFLNELRNEDIIDRLYRLYWPSAAAGVVGCRISRGLLCAAAAKI